MELVELLATGAALEVSAPGKALRLYQRAIETHPDEIALWLKLAAIFRRKKMAAEFRAAIEGASAAGATEEMIAPLRPDMRKDPVAFLEGVRDRPHDEQVRAAAGDFLRRHFDRLQDQPPELRETLARIALPQTIRIETASACNLRCGHCTTGVAYGSTDRRVMKMETFDRVIGQLQRLPTVETAVMYLGGEPLLNKHHALMCKRVKAETSVQITKFVTNGMLLTQAWCDRLADADIDAISISIDGQSPEESNAIRALSDFETIRRNIWMLKDTFDRAGVTTRIQIGNTQFRRPEQFGSKAAPPEFLRREFDGLPISSGWAMVWPGMDVSDVQVADITVSTSGAKNFCDHPFLDFAVRANGDVTLCCYDISGVHVMGNVATDDLRDLYESEAYVELRRAMLSQIKANVPAICQRCANFTGEKLLRA